MTGFSRPTTASKTSLVLVACLDRLSAILATRLEQLFTCVPYTQNMEASDQQRRLGVSFAVSFSPAIYDTHIVYFQHNIFAYEQFWSGQKWQEQTHHFQCPTFWPKKYSFLVLGLSQKALWPSEDGDRGWPIGSISDGGQSSVPLISDIFAMPICPLKSCSSGIWQIFNHCYWWLSKNVTKRDSL